MGIEGSKIVGTIIDTQNNLPEVKNHRPKAEAKFSQEIIVRDPGGPEPSFDEIDLCDNFMVESDPPTLSFINNSSTRATYMNGASIQSPSKRGILKGRSTEKYPSIFNEEAKFVRFAIQTSLSPIKLKQTTHRSLKSRRLSGSECKIRI